MLVIVIEDPTLYELNGDGYVSANADLLPEEAIGYEIGFGVLSLFRYEFEQAIEYTPGFYEDVTTSETVTDPETGETTVITTTEQVWNVQVLQYRCIRNTRLKICTRIWSI